MKLTIELEQEDDGRWIAEITELSGVLVYADTRDAAARRARALALSALADKLDTGELEPSAVDSVSFYASVPALGGRRVHAIEPVVEEQALTREQNLKVWHDWMQHGEQGPITEDGEPELP